jgi:hypothetical protein
MTVEDLPEAEAQRTGMANRWVVMKHTGATVHTAVEVIL